jgi:hypothetical protein
MSGHTTKPSSPGQLSMLEVFAQSEYAQQTDHLPVTITEAIPYYQALIERYDQSIMAGNKDQARSIEQEADLLATHLNAGRAPTHRSGHHYSPTDPPAGRLLRTASAGRDPPRQRSFSSRNCP